MTAAAVQQRLDSWKEIAAHLGRRVRTVQRWEREEGLPVRRHAHRRRGTVYAWSEELDSWCSARQVAPNAAASTVVDVGQGAGEGTSGVTWAAAARALPEASAPDV